MDANSRYERHVSITTDVKKEIEPLSVVLPSEYKIFYIKAADKMNFELNYEELQDSEIINEKIVHHVISLENCTEQAIDAIEHEDKNALLKILNDVKCLREEIYVIEQMIYEDNLTKSYNRRWFEDMYLDADKSIFRTDGIVAIIDLNKFKYINDTYGHIIGDKVLMHVAAKLKDTGGKVVRYGGDEFIVLFNERSFHAIRESIDTMIDNCSRKSFKVGDGSFKVSFAYGLAHFVKGSEWTSVLNEADKAMYQHKQINTSQE